MWWAYGLFLAIGTICLFFLVGIALRKMAVRRRQSQFEKACRLFHQQREWLEARFLTAASRSGRPRGLEWADGEFEDEVSFARDRNTGELRALVGATIGFQAIPGGDMEHVEAVANLRDATAVFRMEGDVWVTDGRAIFNLNPHEAILHFGHELVPIRS